MNPFGEMSDAEFVPFLNSLGVETYKKSFEWMSNDDADFAGILRWLYDNLDCRNALTAREEYRYAELQKKGTLLPQEDLEAAISSILKEHEGLPLPGDEDALEDVQMDIAALKDRLHYLEKQEEILEDVVRQNETAKEELSREVTKLNARESQYKADEAAAAEECLALAKEVESLTESVVDVVADTLAVYENCHTDQDTAKEFLAFGPFDAYKQSQALFRSHFDLYTSKKFNKKQNDNVHNELDLRTALAEAKVLEERLSQAMSSYVETKAELSGEQAKIALVANYEDIHPSQIPVATIEARSAVELLEQEEAILEQQIQAAVKQFAEGRTALAAEVAAQAAVAVREEVYKDLSHLHDTTLHALALDRCLYYALRHSLRKHEEFLQFATELAKYVREESAACANRLESMKSLCDEQQMAEDRLCNEDPLLTVLSAILGVPPNNDVIALVKIYGDLRNDVRELKERVTDGFGRKMMRIERFKQSQQPLIAYLWDGCTRQPNCHDRSVAALRHKLNTQMEEVHKKVCDSSNIFASVRNGDKNNLRKLWQWFLTDPARLTAVMKDTLSKSYS